MVVCVVVLFLPPARYLQEQKQLISIDKLGVNLSLSLVTVFFLLSLVLAFAGTIVRFYDTENKRVVDDLSQKLTKAEAARKAAQEILRKEKTFDLEASLILPRGTGGPGIKIEKWHCYYKFAGSRDEASENVEQSQSLDAVTCPITVTSDRVIERLTLRDDKNQIVGVAENIYPLAHRIELKKE
jgi:hypothetical protein